MKSSVNPDDPEQGLDDVWLLLTTGRLAVFAVDELRIICIM
jgi:hypothetical protein